MIRVAYDRELAITPAWLALPIEAVAIDGRSVTASELQQIDALVVRSVTVVGETLLANTGVRFVGTATAGFDHLDVDYLRRAGVEVATAAGANAHAVMEYVLASLAATGRLEAVRDGASVGIVGLGAVGTRVARVLSGLGATVVAYDPLLGQWPDGVRSASLDTVLSQSIVCLHPALHDQHPHGTRGLIDAQSLPLFRSGQLLINAARGELIDEPTLIALAGQGVCLALDVWPNEPQMSAELAQAGALLTPHIAGYSVEAKARATDLMARALSRFWRLDPHSVAQTGGVNIDARLVGCAENRFDDWAHLPQHWVEVIEQCYPLRAIDARLRRLLSKGLSSADYDQLRREAMTRREFSPDMACESLVVGV